MEPLDSQTITERKLLNMNQKSNAAATSINNTTDHMLHTSSHQYHYIEYYNHYRQPSNTACQCNCTCNKQKQLSYQQQLVQPQTQPQQQQPQQQQQQQRAQHEDYHSLRLIPNHKHQGSIDSQRVAVIVHRQASGSASSSIELSCNANKNGLPPKKSQSETSLLNHSYQALKMSESLNENLFNSMTKLKTSSSCDCDLECTCDVGANKRKLAKQYALTEAMLTADEITVSESDNNSSTIKRCERNQNKKMTLTKACHDSNYNKSNANHIGIYSDGDDVGDDCTTDACLKEKNGIPHDNEDNRPPLPPRPPPRPQTMTTNSNGSQNRHGSNLKKYVIWCLICGGFSCILGFLFLGVYFLLHSYTITVGNFETVPTFVPATLLILTGLCIMSLARRRNRYSYLIKLSGACGLVSALTCALVTVTTTVLHMSRLQALRECEYAQKTRTCTCYSDMIESQVDRVDKEGVRLVFDSLSDCGVVHGSLYTCLRAIFGLSVAGVLVAVFSCMLVYQLLSHERKKMYWEQLELRCRSLYTRQQMPPPLQNLANVGTVGHGCRCCEQCHTHRSVQPLQGVTYPWDENGEARFWSSQPPGNFYSPNPGGDELNACRTHDMPNSRGRVGGWSWNRWWQRTSPNGNSRFRQTPSSPDSQYGFTNNNVVMPVNALTDELPSADNQNSSNTFNVLPGNLPYGVWGPPPPYSDPNSPARRVFYQYLQDTHAMNVNMSQNLNSQMSANLNDSVRNGNFIEQQPATSNCCPQTAILRTVPNALNKIIPPKGNLNYENTPSDSDCGSTVRERDRFSNTLPSRKIKKRSDPNNKSIGPNSHNIQRVSVQQIFSQISNRGNEHNYQTTCDATHADNQNDMGGRENTAFQNSNEDTNLAQSAEDASRQESSDPTESEVYFADVSSCCNVSVKNDHYYEDTKASQRTLMAPDHTHGHAQHHHQHHHHQHHHPNHRTNDNCNGNGNNNKNEDYLAHRFGHRENSIRSRLPFPQNVSEHNNEDFVDQQQQHQQLHQQQIPKDISRQSMCSLDSEAKTEFTDLSPSTPCSGKLTQINDFNQDPVPSNDQAAIINTATFVASSHPYSSESQSLEAHKRSTKNLTEAHYEAIDDNTFHTNIPPRTTNNKLQNSGKKMSERSDKTDCDRSNDMNNYDRQRL